jgi:Glu-tRNA(Gln) amidotransferase subunit E-like FAD-binding protein
MYDRLLKRNLADPVFLAFLFEGYLKNLKRQGNDLIFVTDDLLAYILVEIKKRELPNEAVYVVLDYLSSNGTNVPLERLFDELSLRPMTESDVVALIETRASELDGTGFKSEEKLIEYLIGQVKSEIRGKFPPEKLKDMVGEQVKAKHPATS